MTRQSGALSAAMLDRPFEHRVGPAAHGDANMTDAPDCRRWCSWSSTLGRKVSTTRAPGTGVHRAGQQHAGSVVVEPVQDLDVGAIGDTPVGAVGLPGFVALRRVEPDVGGAGSFAGFKGGQAVAAEDAVDRRGPRAGQPFLARRQGW